MLGVVFLRQFLIDGLGHISALVADDARGLAAVVDPRRAVAAGLLERGGFDDVTWIEGGVPTWRNAGYPVERGNNSRH